MLVNYHLAGARAIHIRYKLSSDTSLLRRKYDRHKLLLTHQVRWSSNIGGINVSCQYMLLGGMSGRLCKNVFSDSISFRRNSPLTKGALHEEETVCRGADCRGSGGSRG